MIGDELKGTPDRLKAGGLLGFRLGERVRVVIKGKDYGEGTIEDIRTDGLAMSSELYPSFCVVFDDYGENHGYYLWVKGASLRNTSQRSPRG